MPRFRQLRDFLVPTAAQTTVSLAASLIYLSLVFHGQLGKVITGAANTNPALLQASYQQQINIIGQFSFTKDLTIGLFWAGVGVVGYFAVITFINLLIALRNEVVMDKVYADSGSLPSHFIEPLTRLVLIAVFVLVLWLTLGALIPGLWIPLFGNLIIGGFSATHALQTLLALLGLAFNFYVLGLLFLAIKNVGQLV